jgi:hypothetical protein
LVGCRVAMVAMVMVNVKVNEITVNGDDEV